MKIRVYSLLAALVCLSLSCLWAEPSETINPEQPDELKEFTKVIERSFDVSSDALVDIGNKYGAINIDFHNKNSVEIKAIITVNARSKTASDEMFEKVEVNIDGSRSKVSAMTEFNFPRTKNFCWSKVCEDFSINYYINMPASCDLACANKYGDVTLNGDLEGSCDMALKYGDFKAANFGDNLDLYLHYGKGNIGYVDDLFTLDLAYSDEFICNGAKEMNAEASYSKFQASKINSLDLDSKYSKFFIDEVGGVKNYGKYDKIDINKLGDAQIESKYTTLLIGYLQEELEVNNAYGEVDVNNVAKDVHNINIDMSHGGLDLDFSDFTNYTIDFQTSYTGVHIPISNWKVVEQEYESNQKAMIAKKGNGESMVVIRMKYGDLKIK